MLIVHAAIPVRETDDKISVLMLLVGLSSWIFKFNFGSMVTIINLD